MTDNSNDEVRQDAPGDAFEETEKERRARERRDVVDRRIGLDRRRGPGRRRSESRKAAEEGQMTEEQWDFLQAMNEYKRLNNRPFPTWSEVLDVLRAIGYRKVAEPSDIE